MDKLIDQLAQAVNDSEDLESLVRPLLELLQAITGLESTYLTQIDQTHGTQRILYALNTGEMVIPEDLEVPWEDTLCKRALEEGRPYTNDVSACWNDSDAARALGITTYLSTPVRVHNDSVYGTLCGASAASVDISPQSQRLLTLFAQLIGWQLERDQLVRRLQSENRAYSQIALTDPLTGIMNRRALDNELTRAMAAADRGADPVYVAFIDLDNFKFINDEYGHDAGDRFLVAMSQQLISGLRDSDLLARYGGDEFVAIGSPATGDHAQGAAQFASRLEQLTTGTFDLGTLSIEYPGARRATNPHSPGAATGSNRLLKNVFEAAGASLFLTKQLQRR